MADSPFKNNKNVFVLNDKDPKNAQKIIYDLFHTNGGLIPDVNGQFSQNRYAVVLQPGHYSDLKAYVPYYTSIIGAGKTPDEVQVNQIQSPNGGAGLDVGALVNFWRSVENIEVTNGPVTWAVSQACPIRQTIFDSDITLAGKIGDTYGPSSGGFISNTNIRGKCNTGSQQQFFFRNTSFHGVTDMSWSGVHVGSTGTNPIKCAPTG